MSDSLCIGTIVISLLMCVYCTASLYKYKSKLNTHTAKLVQLYLDKQFITRILRMLAYSKDDNQSFFEITSSIKEYFQLDDILFYNLSTKPQIDVSPGVFKRNVITQYVYDHQKEIINSLEFKKMIIEEINIGELEAMLYIIALDDDQPNTIILFVQYDNNKLDSSDLETLSSAIKVVLSVMNKKKNSV